MTVRRRVVISIWFPHCTFLSVYCRDLCWLESDLIPVSHTVYTDLIVQFVKTPHSVCGFGAACSLWPYSNILCDLAHCTTSLWIGRVKVKAWSNREEHYGWACERSPIEKKMKKKKPTDSLIGRISHDIQISSVGQPMTGVCATAGWSQPHNACPDCKLDTLGFPFLWVQGPVVCYIPIASGGSLKIVSLLHSWLREKHWKLLYSICQLPRSPT